MTGEITRRSTSQDEEKSRMFGWPSWNDWKNFLLSELGIKEFPDEFTEKILHDWWNLRMRLKRMCISPDEFDKLRRDLFPEGGEAIRIIDNEPNSVLSRGVQYVTNFVANMSLGERSKKPKGVKKK